MFSNRTGWSLAENRLSAAVDARRRAGRPILDLTISNPTLAGIAYPSEAIGEALADASRHPYEPTARGDLQAREAIGRWYAARGLLVAPDEIVLTASTSEAYGWLFKLLSNPGERVLVPRPSYPLFEFLAALESIDVGTYPLRYETRWEIDLDALAERLEPQGSRASAQAGGGESHRAPVRAIVLVNPNNPTGSVITRGELEALKPLLAPRDLPLISDEVFSTYHFDGARRAAPHGGPGERDPHRAGGADAPRAEARIDSLLSEPDLPAFVLDGLSKSAGLPGIKAGWILVRGPEAFRKAAMARLEVIADTYLSVGSPVQRALPRLIELGAGVASRIRSRILANRSWLEAALSAGTSCQLLAADGGWSAVLRVPRTLSEEARSLALLEEAGVLVQPGYFFDFEAEAYLVVSLLTPESDFQSGIARILEDAGR